MRPRPMKAPAPLTITAAFLLGLLLVPSLAAWAESTEQTDADPALWVLQDDDTTIYLFGTVHLLRPGLTWFDEAIAEAFQASDELYLEVQIPESPAAVLPLTMELAVDSEGRTLTSRLSADQMATYQSGMEALGIPVDLLEQFEPWFVSLQVALSMASNAGLDPTSGVETRLHSAAKVSGKPIRAFETVEEQLRFFDQMPEDEQIAGLIGMLENPEAAMAMLDAVIEAWKAGNTKAAGALMNEAMAATPYSARILLSDRNRRWAQHLDARMNEPGTVFVAVGAGHLAGKDDLKSFLEAEGYTVRRVDYQQ